MSCAALSRHVNASKDKEHADCMIHVQLLFEKDVEGDCCEEGSKRVQVDDEGEVDVSLCGIIEDRRVQEKRDHMDHRATKDGHHVEPIYSCLLPDCTPDEAHIGPQVSRALPMPEVTMLVVARATGSHMKDQR